MQLDKFFNYLKDEINLYSLWEESNCFKPRKGGEPYSIMMPPPNVTGSLHMGHALTFTIQDILIRYHRMKGMEVLWQAGTDHAGIATQMVVERKLANQNIDRRSLGREKFIEKVWEWKNESGGQISKQLKRLGASADWSRERFTMDDGLSNAVKKVFVQLFNDKIIYKDKRLVNWDPKLLTAISDLEVEQKEVEGSIWYIKYPIENNYFITIATTRPETMFGDTAIAVHPKDERYKNLVGQKVLIPIVNRQIPIIKDEYADPEQGSGAVKITPAHDFNDFEVGKRNNLLMISIFDSDGNLNENTPDEWKGLNRFEARKRLVDQLQIENFLVKVEDHTHVVPYGDRSYEVIEPFLTDQWYVDAKKLSLAAIKNVEEGKTKFIPGNWAKTYYEWMKNIQPWCISRQLWWGHRIPAWYTSNDEIIVASSESEALKIAKKKYKTEIISQDEDVLDTWFSSALWPFTTLGWPNEENDLSKFYPTNLLVTGFDIIFFWVARMMMMGLYFQKNIPFSEIYIHALVRDENGQKMSKSKGNVVDPLKLIDNFGADSLRFTLASMASYGRDIKLSESRVEGYRNFGTKLWNAARFCELNNCIKVNNQNIKEISNPVTSWLISEMIKTEKNIDTFLNEYKFNEAANEIYHFVWHIFCDWYLELIKPFFNDPNHDELDELRYITSMSLNFILIKLHPFMPFITEELWKKVTNSEEALISSSWKISLPSLNDFSFVKSTEKIIEIITSVRSIRSELNIPSKKDLLLQVYKKDSRKIDEIKNIDLLLNKLIKIRKIDKVADFSDRSASFSVSNIDFALVIDNDIDLSSEIKRIEKEEIKTNSDIELLKKKLSNDSFIKKAPKNIVKESNDRLDDLLLDQKKLGESKLFISKLIAHGK